ncbi:concanavalin A-like lectin/glucanase [Colletotrichum zoysiae]|uniref:Concanavalin A-like lectin/glucanase n=1 Tax=Colletotrichum zoysiae TaxID=1216348 RepID=A0AAD9H516_9PEZI|nr:concanavalin A-like lectin/glucanase [Colletotrichum zoysiae]
MTLCLLKSSYAPPLPLYSRLDCIPVRAEPHPSAPSPRRRTGIMSFRRSPLLSLALALAPLVVADDHPYVADSVCDCYLTNTSERYFTNHIFFDFRSLGQYAGVPDVLADWDASANAPVTSDYFNSDAWTSIWSIQNWNNTDKKGKDGNDATVDMVNSANNIYIEKNNDQDASSDTFMSMRTARLEGFQSSAEIESISMGYHFVSVRMLARTLGGPGACTALFTYREADNYADVQEADIEILTRDPDNRIQYTNQPSFNAQGDTIDKSTRNGTMPRGTSWRDWAVHRLDWDEKDSTWLVDGSKVSKIAFQVPRDPSRVMLNSWSDGGSWSGIMNVGDSAVMQIQWIDMVFNTTEGSPPGPSESSAASASSSFTSSLTSSFTSAKRDIGLHRHGHGPMGRLERRSGDGECQVVCSIDSSDTIGQPVMLHNGTAPGQLLGQSGAMAFWLPVALMTAAFLHLWA